MRILLVNCGISSGVSGGDLHSAEVLKRWGHSHDVYGFLPDEGRPLLAGSKVKGMFFRTAFGWNRFAVKHIVLNGTILYIIRMIQALPQLPKMKFHLVIASSHYPHDLVPALVQLMRNPGAKLVVYDHAVTETFSKSGARGLISNIYSMLGLLLTTRVAIQVFVLNNDAKSYVQSLGAKTNAVTVTANGVNIDVPNGTQSAKKFDACFLGSMRREKGVLDLIGIWEEVSKARRQARLAIIGAGEEFEKIRGFANGKSLQGSIVIFGWLLGEERFGVLAQSRMLVFPSYLESWGLAIAEAMACGLPVVAYDLPIYKEVFEDRLITVPLGDLKAIADKVLFLLENPSIAVEMGKANREFIQRYDWNTVAEKELSVIASLVKRSASHL